MPDNEVSDESNDGELTVRKEVIKPEKESLADCMININHLWKWIEVNTVCKMCAQNIEIGIMQDVVDEFSKK
eukprot:5891987-Ditylum_brightwellii.AAC.1